MEINWTVFGLTLVASGCFGVFYAIAVNWMDRNHIEGQTAYLVAFGVLITVLASALVIGLIPALLTLACFAASGIPVIIEYVLRFSGARKADVKKAAEIAKSLFETTNE